MIDDQSTRFSSVLNVKRTYTIKTDILCLSRKAMNHANIELDFYPFQRRVPSRRS